MNDIYIARQPIVDVERKIVGYELLFRSIENDGLAEAKFGDGQIASTKVAVNTLNHIGLNKVVSGELAFINIDQVLLMTDAILSIPKECFVLELLETIIINDRILNRIIELKKLGFKFALDDGDCSPHFFKNFQPIFPYIYVLKLDATSIDKKVFESQIQNFKKYKFKLLAEKVETEEEFNYYKNLGCTYFQGYFYARPNLIQQKALDPIYKEVFELTNLLDNESTIEHISTGFEASPDITIQLLKFMNSGILTLTSNIRSIKHAIALLGRAPLKQWLLLIAFSKSKNAIDGMRSPLIILAQNRAKLMDLIASNLLASDINQHEASLVGILSLVDVITEVPMEEIIKELTVSITIKEALIDKKGTLGLLLKLAISVETDDIDETKRLSTELDISYKDLKTYILESYDIQI